MTLFTCVKGSDSDMSSHPIVYNGTYQIHDTTMVCSFEWPNCNRRLPICHDYCLLKSHLLFPQLHIQLASIPTNLQQSAYQTAMSYDPDDKDFVNPFLEDEINDFYPLGTLLENPFAASQSVLPGSSGSAMMSSNDLTNDLYSPTMDQAGLGNTSLSVEEGETDFVKADTDSSMDAEGDDDSDYGPAHSKQQKTATTCTKDLTQEQSSLVRSDDDPTSDKNLWGTYAQLMDNNTCHG